MCALCYHYRKHLHGTVIEPGSSHAQDNGTRGKTRGIEGLHVVSYNLRMMETFVRQVSTECTSVQRSVVEDDLDARMRRMATREGVGV